jgi:Ni/Co efflux regulator RcnB
MQKNQWTHLILVCALALSQGSALAQPGRDKGPECRPGDRGCERGYSNRGNSDRSNSDRGNGQRNARHPQPYQDSRRADLERRDNFGQRTDRGAGPDHDFYRGARLPAEYRNHQYVVNDWRGHGLRTPPRGYQWVQTGGDYVLVAIATGIILELLLSR